MAIILFDDNAHQTLRPLTFTRPVADLRIGILTIAEKWSQYLNTTHSFLTQPYLQEKFPLTKSSNAVYINGSVCPDECLLEAIDGLKQGEALKHQGLLIAAKVDGLTSDTAFEREVEYGQSFIAIKYPEDIFNKNNVELRKDFALITKGRTSASLTSTNTIIGNDLFAEDGVTAECSTFNTTNGPIYLGKHSEVWEGTNIRGSFALCDHSQVKMGAKIYGATTVGPYSRVGGEISNAVIWGFSSKGHDGFLGNSVMGEWCNIGADSNNSNLKNNYQEVKLWDYPSKRFRKTGLQFCGLIMGDHSKCGINTMFNTGTVVGVSANVFGSTMPLNFIPDFGWGGGSEFETYSLKKMFDTAELVYPRRDRVFDDVEKRILEQVFEQTKDYREIF
ncbi:GlmU family protein [Mucilaginibacter auburnensis]|uniref:UDP-N-acetylglucosamine diphosphorylase/glucosamine-1-phosphate N-acetyltransferase n=1 Tax=Mucilaginibacter auburnensis TaxID=1457233 RepID=A0A2H9VTS5_9SPHI|nr:GlmU family protein [Mucilaginibacter auburnensis]PJJ84226.1 UDP-N-acetylglucosamine diphosphorylase/glucosamine-1-phosphate N-acetyltransferase [Mucilaginibacter auburnensis]